MEVTNTAKSEAGARALLRLLAAPGLVLAAAILFGIWLGFNYSGLVRWLAQLEYRYFGRWFPVITALSLGVVAALIWRGVVYLRKPRRARLDRRTANERAVYYLRSLHLLFLCGAGLALLLALAAFVHLLALPATGGEPQVAEPNRINTLREGPVVLQGARTIGPLGRYQDSILGIGPDRWFVPVLARDTPLGPEYTLFAEVPDRRQSLVGDDHRGILRRDALPVELTLLYQQNGLRVAKEAPVIFLSGASMRLGSLFFLFEALVAASLALGFAWFARRRAERLEGEGKQPSSGI